ncbi:butyryl-CoA dehydrogenase [Williamsia sp. Leaf354]|jgi:alkylation response protein AidB-like acyl-CoA dehydrogenase|uniref:acyl-CoA dehydrogenase family protein n=1 Tax=Williamsia sp. Leaf354 TaxID=1736349 RepID=UPI0006F2CA84|nr:acyl-CoA dehydrogenase family protein [Williamsia sp. Leaf354]KQR98142.1 butyryl-CoA dehydrogenase [Williamsia sp. Leaf354]
MSTHTEPRDTSAVGKNAPKTNAIGAAMRFLTVLTGSDIAERFGLREPINRVAYQGTKSGFQTLGAATRAFKTVQGGGSPKRLSTPGKDYFNIAPDDEQKMIADTAREFSEEILRPAAHDADEAATAPEELLTRFAELGITTINVPEEFDGAASERGVVTNGLVAEAMAYGDMGLAIPLLAPSGVATTLTQYGSDAQQKTFLPDYAGENVPQSSVIIAEPRALFDAFDIKTKATRAPSGYKLDGVKSFVPAAGSSELFVIGANLDGRPALFLVEADTEGLIVEADPGMGVRAAGMGRVVLNNVSVPKSALLGEEEGDAAFAAYRDVVRLSRLGWSSLAVGTSQAVLDYVVPYVNDRVAFGEPVSNRQGVAFPVAVMATELDALRLVTQRGTSRAEQGLSYAREAALARKLVSDKGMQIGSDGVQLLGGHGFTKEHPVERWYRDLRAASIGEGIVVL